MRVYKNVDFSVKGCIIKSRAIKGYIKIDITNDKIEDYFLPKGYEYCDNHLEHAKRFIVNHLDDIKHAPITEKQLCGTDVFGLQFNNQSIYINA